MVGKVDGRIHFKMKLGVCVWGGAILCGEVAELIVLKGPFVLSSYDSLCYAVGSSQRKENRPLTAALGRGPETKGLSGHLSILTLTADLSGDCAETFFVCIQL